MKLHLWCRFVFQEPDSCCVETLAFLYRLVLVKQVVLHLFSLNTSLTCSRKWCRRVRLFLECGWNSGCIGLERKWSVHFTVCQLNRHWKVVRAQIQRQRRNRIENCILLLPLHVARKLSFATLPQCKPFEYRVAKWLI